MSDYDIWELSEILSSLPVLDQKEILSSWALTINNDPTLQAHAHSVLKPLGAKRNKKRDFDAEVGAITNHIKSKGYITWAQAKAMFGLKKAQSFLRIMNKVPNAKRSKTLHIEGGRNWYHDEDIDPSKWIASHDEGPISLELDPEPTAQTLLQMALNSNERSFSAHKILAKEKSKFKLPDKFNPLRYKEWADRYLTPLMVAHGFNPNANRRVYKKQQEK